MDGVMDDCMFCGQRLPEAPENLAFMEHVQVQTRCDDRFQAWVQNMDKDFIGT